MPIDVVEARNRVKGFLQDNTYTRWTKHELNMYLQQAAEEFVRRVGFPIVSVARTTSAYSSLVFADTQGYTAGETITGATTGTTATVFDSPDTLQIRYSSASGVGFEKGEQITGASSGYSALNVSHLPNYELDLPETIGQVTHVEADGREVPILTESEMRYMAASGGLWDVADTNLTTTRIFGTTSSLAPKWRETTGSLRAVVLTSSTSDKFRLYPAPSASQQLVIYGVYRPLHASDIIPYQFVTTGVTTKSLEYPEYQYSPGSTTQFISDDEGLSYLLSEDSSSLTLYSGTTSSTVYPLRRGADFRTEYNIDRTYMDVLVYGALEKAYLKEHDLRNVEKADYFRVRKEGMTQEALRNEALNSASISGGINYNRLKVRLKAK